MLSQRQWLVVAIVFCIGIAAGWEGRTLLWPYIPSIAMTYDNPALRSKDSTYQFISPLLACETPERKEVREFQPLETDINSLIDSAVYRKTAKTASVYFRDPQKGRWVAINENEQYFPASLLKVPIMMAYFKAAESDPRILSQQLTYDGSFDDNTRADIKPEKPLAPGKSYSVDELIAAMITQSDNNATRLLVNNIDKKSLDEVYTDLGLSIPDTTGNIEFMSVKSYSYFFRVLYNATYLTKPMSDKALLLLTAHDFPQGIMAGVPDSVKVGQKFGESEIYSDPSTVSSRELHDCGMVYHPKNPYLLCSMTKGDNFDDLTRLIQDISRLVYQRVDSSIY